MIKVKDQTEVLQSRCQPGDTEENRGIKGQTAVLGNDDNCSIIEVGTDLKVYLVPACLVVGYGHLPLDHYYIPTSQCAQNICWGMSHNARLERVQ